MCCANLVKGNSCPRELYYQREHKLQEDPMAANEVCVMDGQAVGEHVRGSVNGLSYGVHFVLLFHFAFNRQWISYRNPMERVLKTTSCDLRGKQTSVSVQFLNVNSAPCSRIIESCWAPVYLTFGPALCLQLSCSFKCHISLLGFAEGAKVFRQKKRTEEKQPLAATLLQGLLQRCYSRWGGSW